MKTDQGRRPLHLAPAQRVAMLDNFLYADSEDDDQNVCTCYQSAKRKIFLSPESVLNRILCIKQWRYFMTMNFHLCNIFDLKIRMLIGSHIVFIDI